MAKVVKTAREIRWQKVVTEYEITAADPDNAGATKHRLAAAVASKLRVPLSTVKDILKRHEL